MRTHYDSVINIYRLEDKEKKDLIAFEVLAKIETKTFNIENTNGRRTFGKRILIYFDRKTLKEYDLNDLNINTFLVERIEVNKNKTEEFFYVQAPKSLEGKSETLVWQAEQTFGETDTNNFNGFGIIT